MGLGLLPVSHRAPASSWVYNGKPAIIDPRPWAATTASTRRCAAKLQEQWNQPVWWPLAALAAALALAAMAALRAFRRRERLDARGEAVAT